MIIIIALLKRFFAGLLSALQFWSFLFISVYLINESVQFYMRKNLLKALFFVVLRLFLKYEIILRVDEEIETNTADKQMKNNPKNVSKKLKEDINRIMMDNTSFETAHWLNSLLFEILCTNKSRRLMDLDQEVLISVLTKISRTAIESKLSDYQRESWLFLKSLNLDSFTFGDRLPIIKAIKMIQIKNGTLGIVFDFEYEGGIEVGLKASLAMNFRDFSAKMKFVPSQFKFILKLDTNPTPKVSLMLSDLPAYEISVLMRQQQLNRVGRLLNLLIGNFVKMRLCYPNYLTILFLETYNRNNSQDNIKSLLKIANEKQYQSQLRVRIVSVSLSDDLIDSDYTEDQENELYSYYHQDHHVSDTREGLITLNLNGVTFKTETISLLDCTRFNSIHTFNIYNDSPTEQTSSSSSSFSPLSIHLYQKVSDSLNQLGRIEIPYDSIKAGLLDFRTIPFCPGSTSTITLEMFLNHIEEDGEADANWIFWNGAKPKRRARDTTQVDRSIDKINWNTIKFIISKLSYDTTEESMEEESSYEPEESQIQPQPIPIIISGQDISIDSTSDNCSESGDEFKESKDIIQLINLKLDSALRMMKARLLSLKDESDAHDTEPSSATDPLKVLVEKSTSILIALNYELKEYTQKYNLSRPILSDKIISDHNKRIAVLLAPIIKSFLPAVLRILGRLTPEEFESDFWIKKDVLEKILMELKQIIELVDSSSNFKNSNIKLKKIVDSNTTLLTSPQLRSSSPESPPVEIKNVLNFDNFESATFYAHFGDVPVMVTISEVQGISISLASHSNSNTKSNISINDKSQHPVFDFEGIFYTPKTKITNLSSLLLSKEAEDYVAAHVWELTFLKEENLILIVEMGRSPLFPIKIVNLTDVCSIELIKEQGAFHLGFNADHLQTQSENKIDGINSKNGLLKLAFITENGFTERIDLIGESRSCDQWFYLISSRMAISNSNSSRKNEIKVSWKDVEKCWLLPLNIPSLCLPYTLAISFLDSKAQSRQDSDSITMILSNFFDDTDLHSAYCFIKTLMSKRQATESLLDINHRNTLTNYNSSNSMSRSHSQYSLNSNRSSSSLNWSSASFSSLSSTTARNPFENKNLYDKIVMTSVVNSNITPSNGPDREQPSWLGVLVQNYNLMFECKAETDSNMLRDQDSLGTLAIGPEYICYHYNNSSSSNSNNQPAKNATDFNIIIPRASIKSIKKITNWFNTPIDICVTLKLSSELVYFNNFAKREELELAFEALLGF